jgi:hypothetical protein
MRIHGQYSSINIRFTSRLIFKYQILVREFSELFWIFRNSNWKYFSAQYTSYEKYFHLPGYVNLFKAPSWTPSIRIYLGIRAHNKFKMPDLFKGVNLYSKS